MKKILLAGLATGVMMLGSTGPAFSTVIDGSFTGIVNGGTDTANRFGLGVGADMKDQAITGTFSYDSGAYYMGHDNYLLLNSDGSTSNYSRSFTGPSMTITDTINGHSVTTTSVTLQSVDVTQNYNYFGITPTAMFSVGSYVSGNQYAFMSTGPMYYSSTTILSDIWNIGTADFSVAWANSDLTRSSGVYYDGSQTDVYNVSFYLTSMTAGPASEHGSSPVPEPATMLLFGTGIAGFIGVYRRKKA